VLAPDTRGTALLGTAGSRRAMPLQRLALGAHPGHELDNAADDHDSGADKVTDKQPDRSVPSPRRWPYRTRTDGAKALGDGEAHRNRLGPDLNHEDLADG
jgi:hypothetical protein